MASTLGKYNPLRYRSYVFDPETELYYLQSRYYNPEWGRFISANNLLSTIEYASVNHNLFAYYPGLSAAPAVSNTLCDPFQSLVYNSKGFDISVQGPNEQSTSIIYSVPLYSQGYYSLCWAFCQVMVEDYHAGVVRSNSQATDQAIAIAKSVNGNDWNRGGWPTNAPDVFGELGKEAPSIDELYRALVQYGPIYAYYGGKDGAHLVVVTGVDLQTGAIYTNNPWGISGTQSYSEFMLGFAGKPSNKDMPFGFVIYPG